MTREFYISSAFKGEWRKEIKDALSKSSLPEGVHVYTPREDKPEKPFVIISGVLLESKSTRDLFKLGAVDVIAAYTSEDILKELNKNNKYKIPSSQ